MPTQFLTNYTPLSFLEKLKQSLRNCDAFAFSVSFIKKAGLILLFKDIEAAVARGAKGRIITSTYQNFTDIESLKSFSPCKAGLRTSNVILITNASMTVGMLRSATIRRAISSNMETMLS